MKLIWKFNNKFDSTMCNLYTFCIPYYRNYFLLSFSGWTKNDTHNNSSVQYHKLNAKTQCVQMDFRLLYAETRTSQLNRLWKKNVWARKHLSKRSKTKNHKQRKMRPPRNSNFQLLNILCLLFFVMFFFFNSCDRFVSKKAQIKTWI